MKIEEIRGLSGEELKKKLEEAHRELLDLRFKSATKQLKNHRELPIARRSIARLKMVIHERELEIR